MAASVLAMITPTAMSFRCEIQPGSACSVNTLFDDVRSGERELGDLKISWRGEYVQGAWHIYCTLRLGSNSIERSLDAQALEQLFELHDLDRTVWGRLRLRPQGGDGIALEIDIRNGASNESRVPLCRWKVCDPCSVTPPTVGNTHLGAGDWIKAAWTIGGADQACLSVRLGIGVTDPEADALAETVDLDPTRPIWRKTLRQRAHHAEIVCTLTIASDGTARLDAVLRESDDDGYDDEHGGVIELDYFPLARPDRPDRPFPPTEPDDGHDQDGAYGPAQEFATFAYPRALPAIEPDQGARRFISIVNTTPFQASLSSLKSQNQATQMLALAQDFSTVPSPSYPGQYLSAVSSLPPPMNQLGAPQARALLALPSDSALALQAALTALLGMTPATFIALPEYPDQKSRIQNSLLAALMVRASAHRVCMPLIEALRLCHIAEYLADHVDQADGSEDSIRSEWLDELLRASIVIPSAVQLPASPIPGATITPQGYADIQIIKQRWVGYRLGRIAHIENVMRGESKERSEERSRRIDSEHRDLDADTLAREYEQGSEGREHNERESITNPLTVLKREFDALKQEYGSDGLSVTMTGSWTDTPTGPATLDRSAAQYARHMLDRASAHLARRTESERSRRSIEEFVERNRRRFDNEHGQTHLTGIYRWLDEIHLAHLEHHGNRLMLEIVVANPAADFVQRSQALRGMSATLPTPPWQGTDSIAPIRSAQDIDRDNYMALATAYDLVLPPPPPATLNLCSTLSSDTPRAQNRPEIPPGYTVTQISISYGWTALADSSVAPALDILVGDQVLKIDPATDPNPGTKLLASIPPAPGPIVLSLISAGVESIVHITLACACQPTCDAYLCWQMAAYNSVISAYGRQRETYWRAMTMLAEGQARVDTLRRDSVERDALQRLALQSLIAPGLNDSDATSTDKRARVLLLAPFLRHAIEWEEMQCTFYGASLAGDAAQTWLDLLPGSDGGDGLRDFRDFLEAGAARIRVPVKLPRVLPLLFYLASGGYFWDGPEQATPISEADQVWGNALKSLLHADLRGMPEACWEVEVATSMLMLQDSAALPARQDYEGRTP